MRRSRRRALFGVSLPEIGIPAEVTNAELFRLLPYENELCTVELTGEEFARLVKEIGAASRRGRSVFRFSGDDMEPRRRRPARSGASGKNSRSPVTAYTLTVTPVLKRKLETAPSAGPVSSNATPWPDT